MHSFLAIGSSLILVGVLTTEGAESGSPEVETGFTALFGGKSLAGWHIMNGGRFSVREGVIFVNGGGGWLRSEKQYKDFVLRLDLRFLEKGANSGFYFRAGIEGGPKKTYQVQTMDGPSIGSIYTRGLSKAKEKKDVELVKKTLRPTGQWQSYDITVRGSRVTVKLNGVEITTADGLDPRAGYIGPQGEGGKLEFRNIRIKELAASGGDG